MSSEPFFTCSLGRSFRLSVRGYLSTWWQLLLADAAIDILAILVSLKSLEATNIGLAGTLLCLFCGDPEYDATVGTPFHIPVLWLMTQLVLLVQIGLLLENHGRGFTRQLMIRHASARRWTLSTAASAGAIVFIHIAISLLVCVLLSLTTGGLQDNLTLLVPAYGQAVSSLSASDVAVMLSLVIAGTLLMSQIFVALSLLLSTFWSFFTTTGFLLISSFLPCSLLAGDWTMLRRCSWFTDGGIDPSTGVILSLLGSSLIAGLAVLAAPRKNFI